MSQLKKNSFKKSYQRKDTYLQTSPFSSKLTMI